MEQLISFFTHNPFILIIIAGLLYSMFFRKSPIEKPPGNRPANPANPANRPATGRMPNFGGSQVFPPKQPHQAGEPARQSAPRPDYGGMPAPAPQPMYGEGPILPMPAMPAASQASPYKLRQQAQSAKPEEPRPAVSRHRSAVQPSANTAVAKSAGSGTALSPNDLAQAVIWAEIIGPPRAKRPYFRR